MGAICAEKLITRFKRYIYKRKTVPIMNIPESFIHYVWEKGLAGQQFILDTGDDCRILKPGKRGNRDGPDFENTEIVINQQHLAGNAEIHLCSSDWFRHGHHTDPAYDKTILHIVLKNDAIICNQDGCLIPSIVLPADEITRLYENYSEKSMFGYGRLHCSDYISAADPERFLALAEKLAKERIIRKSVRIQTLLENNHFDWPETTWKAIVWAFGLNQNTVPMEWLSNTISWKNLRRAGNVFSIEAILLGQGGFLDKEISFENGYLSALKQEYLHWKNMFMLSPVDLNAWKYNPVRPSAMPESRLAQVAALVSQVPELFSELTQANTKKDFYQILRQPVSGYWKSHCRPETERKNGGDGEIGKTSVDLILINAVVPLLIAFSEYTGNRSYENKAWFLLKSIAPEQNKIIDIFVRNAGIKVCNALESQGLIELFDTFCSPGKCASCPVMNELIRSNNHE